MARVYLIDDNPRSHLFYSVERPVGVGSPNQRDDVLLVQFLLRVRAECGEGSAEYVPPGEQPLAMDGMCGPQTIKYIKQYQKIASQKNPAIPLVQDGVVSPVAAGTGGISGPVTGRMLCIAGLNSHYGKIRGKPATLDITKDPLFPLALRPYLKVAAS